MGVAYAVNHFQRRKKQLRTMLPQSLTSEGSFEGAGGRRPPPSPKEKEKKKQERKKEKREKREKKERKKEGNYMNNVKLLGTYKVLFFSKFSIVRWH